MLRNLAPDVAAALPTRIRKADFARAETSTTKSQGTMLTAVG